MAFTEPLFCLPIALTAPTVAHVRVTFSNSSIGATTVEATLATGTYWNHRQAGDADSLGQQFIDVLNAAEAAKGGGFLAGTWASLSISGGLSHRQAFKRTAGHANDTITKIEFIEPGTGLTGNIVGFSSDTVTPTAGSPGATYEFTSTWQRGNVWAPRDDASRDLKKPRKLVRSSVSPFNFKSTVFTFTTSGASKRYNVELEAIIGVLIWQDLATDSDWSASLDGHTLGDTNVCLETFWDKHATLEPIRYFPDDTDPTTYDEIEVVDAGWLSDLEEGGGVTEINDQPLLYNVTFPAQEYVS